VRLTTLGECVPGVPGVDLPKAVGAIATLATMWVFLTRRLRQWMLMAVVLPVVLKLVAAVRKALQRRSGRTRLVRALTKVETLRGRR